MTNFPVPAAPNDNKSFLKLWLAMFPILTGLLAWVGSTASWTAGQSILVIATANAVSGVVIATAAHFWPDSTQEPVAVQTAATALVLAVFNLGNGFGWWALDQSAATTINGVLGFLFVLPSYLTRKAVYAQRGVTHAAKSAHAQGMAATGRRLTDGSELPGAPK